VAILYCHNYLISLVRLGRQRKLLMRTDVKRREIWEWSDHTPSTSLQEGYTEVLPDKTSPQDARKFIRKSHCPCRHPDLVLILA
jgi:hypothetical protein